MQTAAPDLIFDTAVRCGIQPLTTDMYKPMVHLAASLAESFLLQSRCYCQAAVTADAAAATPHGASTAECTACEIAIEPGPSKTVRQAREYKGEKTHPSLTPQSPSVYFPCVYSTRMMTASIGLSSTNCRAPCLHWRTKRPLTMRGGRQQVM